MYMNKLYSYLYGSFYQKTGFFVRGTGHFILNQKEAAKFADYAEIFWCVRGSAAIDYEGKRYIFEDDMIFYFPPNTLHDMTPLKPEFDYHWLSFGGNAAGMLFQALNIKPGLNKAGPCPDKLFHELRDCLEDHIPEQQLCALEKAFAILICAINPGNRKKKLSLPEKIKKFLDENYSDHELNVNLLADRFNIHRVTLCRQFHAQYAVKPAEYLASLRVNKAVVLLKETDFPFEEIARSCGFANANYMAKVLKKNMSATPKNIRKEY